MGYCGRPGTLEGVGSCILFLCHPLILVQQKFLGIPPPLPHGHISHMSVAPPWKMHWPWPRIQVAEGRAVGSCKEMTGEGSVGDGLLFRWCSLPTSKSSEKSQSKGDTVFLCLSAHGDWFIYSGPILFPNDYQVVVTYLCIVVRRQLISVRRSCPGSWPNHMLQIHS